MKIQTVTVGTIETNCYLLESESNPSLCVIVDPGAEGQRVASLAEAAGCTPAAILLTHGHYDHTGGVRALREKWPETPVYLNRRDVYDSQDYHTRQFFPPVPDTRDYDEGDTLHLAEDIVVQVLATPGHSEGSVTLLCGSDMLCGDTLFAGSCGRTDLIGGDPEKMLSSLRRLGQLDGNFRVWPGHMEASDMRRERQSNPYVLQALRTPE